MPIQRTLISNLFFPPMFFLSDRMKPSESNWEEFCKLKSSEEFQTESRKGQELARKNKHPHYLGTLGYVGAKKKWAKEDEEAEKYGQQPMLSNFTDDRIQH